MTQEETWHQLMNMTECNVMSSATHVTNVIYMCEKTNKCIQWQHVTRCVQQWLCSGVWVDINIHCTWHWPLPLPLPASNICGPLALGYCPYQGQGPRWGWGVSRSQVQLSGTVCQPPCEPQLSPPRRSLDIWRLTCSADRQRARGLFRTRSTSLLIIIIITLNSIIQINACLVVWVNARYTARDTDRSHISKTKRQMQPKPTADKCFQ